MLNNTRKHTAVRTIAPRSNSRWIAALLGALLTPLALTGCTEQPERRAMPAQALDETFKDFGNYEVHFNALRTDELTPDVARAYGIQRSSNRVMLNVTVLRKEAEHAPRKPVEANVAVDAYNLNGQLKDIEMRRVSEGEAIYSIGEVSISGSEILVFDINVTPNGESAPFNVKLKREFVAN
ncbi:DUF4426 domain-containing protein [Steroidobacter sp. S1-65]|uniref:DUF4426 domain-containing protein n=1 Tax=Steroidobacter gossypii TaxID=2805490 RepID=A0ABS1X303_9GAMM|nr:DUF4426 domain-containing protein [Steroidobacter gossypii]MBM0107609.1 DUF4426 domain-containing protein [Steroidobacter gossypii]